MKAKKQLFICNTYMQLITAIQMKLTLFRGEETDLVLSDHSANAETVCGRVRQCGVFSNVMYVQTRHMDNEQGRSADLLDVAQLTFCVGKRFESLLWRDCLYETIFYFNAEPWLIRLCDENVKRGNMPRLVCYEEGVLSYPVMRDPLRGPRVAVIRRLRKLLGKTSYFDRVTDFYCYYSALLTLNGGQVHSIPALSRDDLEVLRVLDQIFAYAPEENDYPQKYIFFASSSDVDGNPVGETELVLKIADMVGKEELLVKMHPRDQRDVYEKYGITVSRNTSVPWEVIQLNHGFAGHVFLTISSGSVLNASAMLGDSVRTCYLYPLVRGRSASVDRLGENIGRTVAELQKTGALDAVCVTDTLSGILEKA